MAFIGCKKVKKEVNTDDISVKQTEKVVQQLSIGNMDQWEYRGLSMTNTNEMFQNQEVYIMSVIEHPETYEYVAVNNIKINYTGGRYKISLLVKSNKENNNFGIRIQEVYPTRFDAVFDLTSGEVIGTFSNSNFTDNENLVFDPVGDGWFKCSITADIYSSYFRLAFGPTTVAKKQVHVWEAQSLNKKEREIFMIPSSLTIEEIEY
jgi:hypothetical protein